MSTFAAGARVLADPEDRIEWPATVERYVVQRGAPGYRVQFDQPNPHGFGTRWVPADDMSLLAASAIRLNVNGGA